MRRAQRARVQVDSTTTPATIPGATCLPRALEEDGAVRAPPQAIALRLGALAEDGADDERADDVAYDDALVDDDVDVDDDELETTMPMGLHLTKSNTVSPDLYHRLQCIVARASLRARAQRCAHLPVQLVLLPPNAHALSSRHVQAILKRHGGGKGKSNKGPPSWTMVYSFNSPSAANTVPTSWQGASPEVLNHLKTLNGGAGWVADGM
jgi:hypothetical protein